jgi:hypothetical protein
MSGSEAPLEGRPLQDDQDAEAPETRPAEEEGPSTTPEARTDLEQDEEGGSPADG